jgi:hypothetical protein
LEALVGGESQLHLVGIRANENVILFENEIDSARADLMLLFERQWR